MRSCLLDGYTCSRGKISKVDKSVDNCRQQMYVTILWDHGMIMTRVSIMYTRMGTVTVPSIVTNKLSVTLKLHVRYLCLESTDTLGNTLLPLWQRIATWIGYRILGLRSPILNEITNPLQEIVAAHSSTLSCNTILSVSFSISCHAD